MLDVPGQAAGLGMRVSIDHCCLRLINFVPSSKHMLCQSNFANDVMFANI